MPVSADTTQIAIVKEVTYGVTPATPVFEVFNITSESLVAAADTEQSNTLDPNRQVVDSFLNGIDVSGSLDFEFAKSPAMTLILESAMGLDQVLNGTDTSLTVGIDQISYTVEKRWPDPVNAGQYLYHRYTGCVSNTFSLDLTAGAAVTGSVGLVGKTPSTDTAMITGATYVVQPEFNVFRGPDMTAFTLDNEAGTLAPLLTDSCVTDVSLNIDNAYRGVKCLGTLGNKEVVIGKFVLTYDQTVFFTNNEVMDTFIDQDYINETFTLGDIATDDHYIFTTTRGKFASNEVVAGGTGTDVVNSMSLAWLVDNTLPTTTTITIESTETP